MTEVQNTGYDQGMLATLLSGCLFVSDADHAARVAQAMALFDTGSPDLGTEDSGGSDSAETGERADTGDAEDGSGRYEGTFTMTVDGLLGADTCVGTATAVIDRRSEPPILGEASCSYGGVYDLYGVQTGTLEGADNDATATGAIEFGSGITVADIWTGGITPGPPPRLTASFAGSTSCDGTNCEYSGTFSMDRID